MEQAWLLIWPLQAGLMFFDEFYLHRKRGLGRWESIGHPLDTICFLVCFIFCLSVAYSPKETPFFSGLGALSCLIIAKDEWVHHKECGALEQWIHSLLFVVHPVSLFALFQLWKGGELAPVWGQTVAVGAFLIHQIYYWNFRRGLNEDKDHQQRILQRAGGCLVPGEEPPNSDSSGGAEGEKSVGH